MFKTFIASALFIATQAMEMETELELYSEWGGYGNDYDDDYGYARGGDYGKAARGYDAGYGRAGAGARYDQGAKGGYGYDAQDYGKAAQDYSRYGLGGRAAGRRGYGDYGRGYDDYGAKQGYGGYGKGYNDDYDHGYGAGYDQGAKGYNGQAYDYGDWDKARAYKDYGDQGYKNAGARGDRSWDRYGGNQGYAAKAGYGADSGESYAGDDGYSTWGKKQDGYGAKSAEGYADAAYAEGARGDKFGGNAAAAAYKAGYEKDIDRKWGGFDQTKIRYGESGAKAAEAHGYGGGSKEAYGRKAGAAGQRGGAAGGWSAQAYDADGNDAW